MPKGAQSVSEIWKAGRHKQLESPQLWTNVHHLSKTIGAGVVDQVERLDGGAVVQPVASVVGSSSVVMFNARMKVGKVNNLQKRQVPKKAGDDSWHDLFLCRLALRIEV